MPFSVVIVLAHCFPNESFFGCHSSLADSFWVPIRIGYRQRGCHSLLLGAQLLRDSVSRRLISTMPPEKLPESLQQTASSRQGQTRGLFLAEQTNANPIELARRLLGRSRFCAHLELDFRLAPFSCPVSCELAKSNMEADARQENRRRNQLDSFKSLPIELASASVRSSVRSDELDGTKTRELSPLIRLIMMMSFHLSCRR